MIMTATTDDRAVPARRREGPLKRLMPRSLLGRSLLIIVTPLVILQLVSAFVFYESHWNKVSRRMAWGVAGDVAAISDFLRSHPDGDALGWVRTDMAPLMEFRVEMREGEILPNEPLQTDFSRSDRYLVEALEERLHNPFMVDTQSDDERIIVLVQHADGVLRLTTTRKRLFSSTTYVFVLWMVGTSLILFGVATLFMRNQVRPIRRLAAAADSFGKGRELRSFKPEGAREVRQAGAAFLDMRDRIKRHIGERTQMLAGVSHDLRTPLTRMKLQLAMSDQLAGADELKEDVAEMERMLEGYLAFARGEGAEQPRPTNLSDLLADVVQRARRKGGQIDLHTEGTLTVPLKPNAFERCVTNLIDNAVRYGIHVAVRAGRRDDAVEVTIDDDGPGIPEDKRADVFKPFFRMDQSRNPQTGGTGLGLTIARDVIRGHGGEIALLDSPFGGLRVRLRLPL
jgi:two-component system osmolarity sensor histidine kinase EnvZ